MGGSERVDVAAVKAEVSALFTAERDRLLTELERGLPEKQDERFHTPSDMPYVAKVEVNKALGQVRELIARFKGGE